MEKLFERLSSYQLFGGLIPGSLYLLAVCYPAAMPTGMEIAATLLVAYVIGVALNRIGAIPEALAMIAAARRVRTDRQGGTIFMQEDEIAALYQLYDRSERARSIYDSYVMYRTLSTTMIAILITLTLHATMDVRLAWCTFALFVIFLGSAVQQYHYLKIFVRRSHFSSAPTA